MKNIIISDIASYSFQGKSSGHYFAVARNYQEMFGDKVIVAGGPVYKTGFADDELLQLPYNAGGSGIKVRLKTIINAIKLFKKAKGQIIVLQQCSTITTYLSLALFFGRESKLFIIQYNLEGLRSKIGKLLFKLAKSKIDGIICPNDMVGRAFQGVPYCVVPDYIYTGTENNVEIPYKDRKYDISIVGRISPEKGIVEVAQKLANTQYSILIAGKPQNNDIASELKSICDNAKNIELHLGVIPDEEYYGYLRNGRYAFLNYSGEYSERSSGVVFDTLFNGVPVIGKRCKSLQFIEDENLGYLYSDIRDCDISGLYISDVHNTYMEKIAIYRVQQQINIEKLRDFLNN